MELAIYKEEGVVKVFTQALTLRQVANVFKNEIVDIESLELMVDEDFSFDDPNFQRDSENGVVFNKNRMGIGELSDRILALFKEESQVFLYNVSFGNANFGLTSRMGNDFVFTFWEQDKLMNFLEIIDFYNEHTSSENILSLLEAGKGYATTDFLRDFKKAGTMEDFVLLRGTRETGKLVAEERARRLREMNIAFEVLEGRFVILVSGIRFNELGYALRDEVVDVRDLFFDNDKFYKDNNGLVTCDESLRFCEREQTFGELISRLKELELRGEDVVRLFGKNESFILVKGDETEYFEMSFSQKQPLDKVLDFIEFFVDSSTILDIKECMNTGDRYATPDFKENFFKTGSVRKFLYFLMEQNEKERLQ